MDKETLSNFISNCGKHDFEIACKIILQDAMNLNPINVDGSNDGGTDFVSIDEIGKRTCVAYQITTQKTDIRNKAYRDAKKSIDKLNIKRYFFFCTYNLSEIESRDLENVIFTELEIAANVYSPKLISGLLINYNLVGTFLDRIGYDNLYEYDRNSVDYREVALHSYSLLSKDARNLKSQIYDDSLLLVLSEEPEGLTKEDIIHRAMDMLVLPESKYEFLFHRIDSLMSKGQIAKSSNNSSLFVATPEVLFDIRNRRILYEKELTGLYAAQVDILKEYEVDWTKEDSRQASVWIANTFMSRQIHILEVADASLADNFNKTIDKYGYSKLKSFLKDIKKIEDGSVEEAADKLIQNAASQPLILKITHATVYLALEGSNPLTVCKAIGVHRWQDLNMVLEPTLGIPYLCSLLYKGNVNRYFDNAICAVKRCKKLGVKIGIPYYYIKECAGHLHMARKFDGLVLDPEEMQYSSNAFVANYYALKSKGVTMPSSFIDYLATFSPAIRTERADYKEWIHEIMNDISSLFTRNGIEFLELRTFTKEEIKPIQSEYIHYLQQIEQQKSPHLMMNDVFSLLYVNDQYAKTAESWMILT